jgi:hypothetical protein
MRADAPQWEPLSLKEISELFKPDKDSQQSASPEHPKDANPNPEKPSDNKDSKDK